MRRTGAIGLAFALALASSAAVVRAQDVEGEPQGETEGGESVVAEGELERETEDGEDVAAEGELAGGEDVGSETASATDTERAREEFARGIACVEEHETRCAVEHFRAALELHDAPAIRYNLASALFEIRMYPEAARHVAAVLADPEAPEDIRGHSETLQAQLREQGGTLEITVSGAAEGTDVEVDDDPIPASQQAEVIVAPGARVVEVVRDEEVLARQEVEVAAGERATVELVVVPSPEEVAEQTVPEEPEAGDAGPAFYEEWPFWAIVGGSVALVAVIVIVAVVAAENPSIEQPVVGTYDPGILRWD